MSDAPEPGAPAFTGFGRPTLARTVPDLACIADGNRIITLTGQSFLEFGNRRPVVRVGEETVVAAAMDDCQPVPGSSSEETVNLCTRLTFAVPYLFPPGSYDVSLQNPEPADRAWADPIRLVLLPAPSALEVHEDLFCSALGDQRMTVTGSSFHRIADAQPEVTVTAWSGPSAVTKTYPGTVEDCVPIDGDFTEKPASTCRRVSFTVPKGELPPADYKVSVKNPAPARCGAPETPWFHVASTPTFGTSGGLKACIAGGTPQTWVTSTSTAGDFLMFDPYGKPFVYPRVTIDSTDADAVTYGCTEIKLPQGKFREGKVHQCTGLSFPVPKASLSTGTHTVTVTNPAPAAGSVTGTSEIVIVPPPTVSSVVPAEVCAGGGAVTINGTDFFAASTATFSDVLGVQPSFAGKGTKVDATGTQMTVTFPAGMADPGTLLDVIVRDPGGCEDPAPHKRITVKPGPVLIYNDQDTVYSGANTLITLHTTQIVGGLASTKVVLKPSGAGSAITYLPGAAVHPLMAVTGKPNQVSLVVDKGTPPGNYDIEFTDALACPAVLSSGLKVTGGGGVNLSSATPGFGSTARPTVVEARRAGKYAPGGAGFPMYPTPRVFLNKHDAGATDLAIALGSVRWWGTDLIDMTIPAGLPPAVYDLVVLNVAFNGSAVMPSAFTVLPSPPPVISAVTPSSVMNAAGQAVVLSGTDFSAGAVPSFTRCETALGGISALPNAIVGGAVGCAGTRCTLNATIDAGNLAAGSVCVLRLTNTDGSYAEYSGVGVSLALSAPRSGYAMQSARRALVAASVDATDRDRFVFAIGGDDGTVAGAATPYKTVEAATVGPFGYIHPWSAQPYDLGTGRSLAAGIAVGRYIYVCGGFDGTASLATCKRAMVLSPSEAPMLDLPDARLGTTGLAAGFWYYQVSAVFSGTDPDNANGESLPSDPMPIRLPAVGAKKLQLQLSWKPPVDSLGVPLPNVVGYRVYRTAAVVPAFTLSAGGARVLLGTTSTTTFLDDGSAVPGTAVPLRVGHTGQWSPLPNMSVPRRGLAMSYGFDPTDASRFYAYSFFGLDGATANDTYEFLPVTIGANGRQAAAATWTTGASKTAAPRWQVGAFRVDGSVLAAAAPRTYLYVGGGLTAVGATDLTVEAGTLGAGGDLGALVAGGGASPVKNFSVGAAGYGVCAANSRLFTFGGQGAAPAFNAKVIQLAAPQPGMSGAWSNEGLMMLDPLYLPGTAVQNAFIFILGGQTGSTATKYTQRVVW